MVNVVDKRGLTGDQDKPDEQEVAVPVAPPQLSMEPTNVDRVDILLAKTFAFITSQPEFIDLLALPKPVRKKIGQDFGRMLTRFPHFNKAGMNE